jgi:predicted dehydrogenase
LSLSRSGAERSVPLMRENRLVLGIGHERRWEPPIAQLLRRGVDRRSARGGPAAKLQARPRQVIPTNRSGSPAHYS